ncbi:hypothetical protein BDZ89DRAFT_125488 [Hymenopellis radicata]|nr:hypothetical protein BDZ89DRAFT_125488 [Hymenopellis radicata]
MPSSSFDDSSSNGSRDRNDGQSKPPDSIRNVRIPAQPASKRRSRKRKLAGFKGGHSRVERGTDAFDYEQKFSEDEPFKEMGPMARVWKTFLEEYAKFDADRVEDWRDALDVLLVFAGLFSAVVSTFVTQTSPNLQVDYNQVSAYMMYEMLHLQRAMMDGLPASSVVSSNITPTSPVRPSRTDAWVNVLWYTSLALSLTTALMAVLMKQWIHQYMAVPSGTPRDRSRIRQFRFENIEKWHVPLIIGLLPVLMHVALGVFFFGLILHVRSLNTPGAALVSVIAFIAFVAYFGTTFLPILRPDCPYKTYLTLYSYSISASLCTMSRQNRLCLWITRHLRAIRWSFPGQSNVTRDMASAETPPWTISLRDVEKLIVESMSDALEARALIGLYNISSNTSVQSIVLQAMSALPLELFSVIKTGIPDVAQRICMLVESMEYTAPDKQTAYERLYRVHIRIEPPIPEYEFVPPNVLTPSLTRAVRGPNTLSLLVSRKYPEHAIAFLRHHISLGSSSCQRFDVLVWARILQNALSTGVDWLDVGDNDSPVWSTVLPWLIQSHGCSEITMCDPICVGLVSLPLFIDGRHPEFGALNPNSFRLKVRTSPEFPSAYPVELRWIFTILLRPSIVEYLLLVLFPDTCSGEDYDGLPADILFNLALIQTRHVLLNSKTGSCDEPDEDEPLPIPRPQDGALIVTHKTPVAELLFFIREYVGLIYEDWAELSDNIAPAYSRPPTMP